MEGSHQKNHDLTLVHSHYVPSLRACAQKKDLLQGTKIHASILKSGLLGKNSHLASSLVSMYAKCGTIVQAMQVLDKLPVRHVVVWSAIISGYIQEEQSEEALKCFEMMKTEGVSPNSVSYICTLKACGSIQAIDKGKLIHYEIIRQGLCSKDTELCNALIDMYVKCGVLTEAEQVLDELLVRDEVSWNTLIAGYVQEDQARLALNSFIYMQHEGLLPSEVTFICILKACGSVKAASEGKKIHRQIVCQGVLIKNIALGNSLVDMYAKCGLLLHAQQVLEELPVRNVVSWSALITGYAQQHQSEEALKCYEQMQHEGISPNQITFACILKACACIGVADKGKLVYNEIASQGLLRKNIVLASAVVDMFAKCGALAKAQQVVDVLPVTNIVFWNALIAGYAEHEQGANALSCFEQLQREGLSPDIITFTSILKACATVGSANKGKTIHEEIINHGLMVGNMVVGAAAVHMYVKCGALGMAQEVLNKLPSWNVISWNALISGYAQMEQGENAVTCFEQMQLEGLCPDMVTYTCALKACGSIGAVKMGKRIHEEVVSQGLLGSNIVLGTALVDMYAKCGVLAEAQQVFDELPLRNAVSWNALISGYAQQAESEKALDSLEQMLCEGLSPDAVTLTCVLSACSCSYLVNDAQMYLNNMSMQYGIALGIEHYTCSLSLLGLMGHFGDAISIIRKMQSSRLSSVWYAFLGACRKWGNVKLGEWAFKHAVQVDRIGAVVYVYMANIYVAAGLLEDAWKIEAMRLDICHIGEIDVFGREECARHWL